MNFLSPFIAVTADRIDSIHAMVTDYGVHPAQIIPARIEELRLALATLLPGEWEYVWSAALLVRRARHANRRVPCGKALSCVMAPAPRYGVVTIMRGERDV